MNRDTTICAIASPPGKGAIAIIRLSGSHAFTIISKIFVSSRKAFHVIDAPAGTFMYGTLQDKLTFIDEVVILFYRKPHSFTGEDLIEITCHGSTYIQQRIIEALITYGAIQAMPGEFSLRAFMNGKVDLSQAEAIADVISSESKAAHKLAIQQMRGGFSKEIAALRQQLLSFISLIELELDFSEEEVEFVDRSKLIQLIESIQTKINTLTESFQLGNAIKNGIPVALAGRTNAGKSTLLNALLNEERAIVSDIHGTTRDTIEETININGIAFRFIDTAGLRETTDVIENLGIARTMNVIANAIFVLLIVDASENIENIESQVKDILSTLRGDQKLLLILNKSDTHSENANKYRIALSEQHPTLVVSAKSKNNIEAITQYLIEHTQFDNSKNDVIVTNLRHYEALQKASHASVRVLEGLQNNVSGELIAMDIREMLHYMGEISGEISNNEILGNIFEKFCIGK